MRRHIAFERITKTAADYAIFWGIKATLTQGHHMITCSGKRMIGLFHPDRFTLAIKAFRIERRHGQSAEIAQARQQIIGIGAIEIDVRG